MVVIRVAFLFYRLPDRQEQEAVRRHPNAGRPGRVISQVRSRGGRHRGVAWSAAQVRNGRHSSAAAATIVVARIAVRIPVRQPIFAVTVPVSRHHRGQQ